MKESAYFWGYGYIKLSVFSLGIKRNLFGEIFLAILFSSEGPNGTILYWPVDNNNDFFLIKISKGFLHISYQFFGKTSVFGNNFIRVDDGYNHLLIIKKRGKKCVLELDHNFIYGNLFQTPIPVLSNYIYLGW